MNRSLERLSPFEVCVELHHWEARSGDRIQPIVGHGVLPQVVQGIFDLPLDFCEEKHNFQNLIDVKKVLTLNCKMLMAEKTKILQKSGENFCLFKKKPKFNNT